MFESSLISMEKIQQKANSNTHIIEMIDRLLNHFQRISRNNMKTMEIYIDLCKEKNGVSSKKLKEIYRLLTDNKAEDIFYHKEKKQLEKLCYDEHEAIVRLSWRFVERIILKCSYFMLNKKHLHVISDCLIRLIKLNRKLSKSIKEGNNVQIMTSIISQLSKENQKLEYEIFELLLDRGYVGSIEEFYSINGFKKNEEDKLYERTIFQEDEQNQDEMKIYTKDVIQSLESVDSMPNLRHRQRKETFLPLNRSKVKKQTMHSNISRFGKKHRDYEEEREKDNIIKPTNYTNWRKQRSHKNFTKIISMEKMSNTIDEKFERFVSQIVNNDIFSTHVERDSDPSLSNYFSPRFFDKEEEENLPIQTEPPVPNYDKEDPQFKHMIRNIKRSNTGSSTSKISSRIIELMERVSKQNKKKQKKNYHIFSRKPKNKLRTSINLLMGQAILNKENIKLDLLKFESSSSINSALTIKSLKLKNDFCNRKVEKKKFSLMKSMEKENLKQTMINSNKLEKQILIEKEMINMMFQKNQERQNSEMFKNALIKERYSQKKESKLEKSRKASKNFQIKNQTQPQKSPFYQIQQQKQEIIIDETTLNEKVKTKTQPSEELLQTFPQYCRHENIGKKEHIPPIKAKDKCFTGPKFQVYDTRRRMIL